MIWMFAIRADDADAAGIRARVVRRDARTGEDYVRLYLDTFNDRRRAYVFTFNPLGIQADGLYNEGTSTGREFDSNIDATWDGIVTSAGRIDESGYVVEAAIPFRTLRFAAGDAQVWGLHVQRWIARKGERTSWRPVSREGVVAAHADGHDDRVAGNSPCASTRSFSDADRQRGDRPDAAGARRTNRLRQV